MFKFNNIFSSKPVVETTRVQNEMDDFDMTQSYLESVLILEDEYTSINVEHYQVTHMAMKENNIDILTEGLGDILRSIVKFFANLLEKFKGFMKKAFMIINAYIGDFGKFLDKYKDQLGKLNPDFTIKGFEYTINSDIPKIDKIKNIIDDYNTELNNVDKLTKAKIIKQREEYTSSNYLDKVRGYIIGTGGDVSSDEYVDECKKVYRKNQSDEQEIHVDKSYLSTVLSQYSSLSKLYTDITKERDKTILMIDQMKNFFQNGASVYYKGQSKTIGAYKMNTSSTSNQITKGDKIERGYEVGKMEILNTFFNYKFAQSKSLGVISITAMVEKVNAIKEQMKLMRVIVRKSMFNEKKESN